MPADIFFYALVTAGLIFWLRNILGTRHGEERDRPVPYLKPVDGADGNDAALTDRGHGAEAMIIDLAQNPRDGMAIADKSTETALLGLAAADRGFDVCKFLRAAQDAFVFIVESFAEGDRDTLRELLAPEVYTAFDSAITARLDAGETMQTEIVAIKKSEIIEARLEGKKALVTVRFFAEEISVTRDANGEIIAGHPEKITQMRDVWTFAHDIKSRDPRWLLVATREDGAEDNDTIPNSH